MTIRLGYQIPNFSYGTPVSELFPTVIAQARIPVLPGDDAQSLAARLLPAEHELLVSVLRDAVAGQLALPGPV